MARIANTSSQQTRTAPAQRPAPAPAPAPAPVDDYVEVESDSEDTEEEIGDETASDIFFDSVKKIPKKDREIGGIKYSLGEESVYFPAVDAEYELEVISATVFRSKKNNYPYMSFKLQDVDDGVTYTYSIAMSPTSSKQTTKMVMDNLVRTLAPMCGMATSSISEEELSILSDLFNGRNKKLAKSLFEDNTLAGNVVIGKSTVVQGKDGKEYTNMKFKPVPRAENSEEGEEFFGK
jgi:hypothetical protein